MGAARDSGVCEGFCDAADANEKPDAANDGFGGSDVDTALVFVAIAGGVELEPKEKLPKGLGALAGSVESVAFAEAASTVTAADAGAVAAGFPNENPPKGEDVAGAAGVAGEAAG